MPLVPFAKASDVQVLSSVSDDLARLAVEVVSGRIRDHVRWDVDQHTTTYTRLYRDSYAGPLGGLDPALACTYHDRHHPATIVLPCFNLTDVASVVVDDRTLTTTEWDATTSGMIVLHGVYPSRKVAVTYTAGWVRQPEDECPAVFRDVCLSLAVDLAANPERLRSYTMGGDSESFGSIDLDGDTEHRLDRYTVEGL